MKVLCPECGTELEETGNHEEIDIGGGDTRRGRPIYRCSKCKAQYLYSEDEFGNAGLELFDKEFTDEQIDFMRQDLESNFALTKIINATRERFKKEGRDFEAEFKKWKEQKHKSRKGG